MSSEKTFEELENDHLEGLAREEHERMYGKCLLLSKKKCLAINLM